MSSLPTSSRVSPQREFGGEAPGVEDGARSALIRLQGLNKSYQSGGGGPPPLKDGGMTVPARARVRIIGSPRSGETTLLNILGLLDDYDTGSYHLADTLIWNLGERRAAQYRNRFIGFVFQSFNLLAFKTALENVALPLYYQGVPRKERNRQALEYLRK